MNDRYAFPVSVLVHAGLLAALAVISFDRPHKLVQPPGMELEIIDSEHAMPLPDPTVQKEVAEQSAPQQEQATVTDPAPVPVPQTPVSAPPAPPVPQPQRSVQPAAPMVKQVTPAKPAEVKQLGPGPVAVAQKPVPPAPKVAAAPSQSKASAQVAAARVANTQATPRPTAPVAPAAPARPKLDASALARMLASKNAAGSQTRINSAAIGSAIGRAAPRGAAGLTVRQRANLEEMIRSQITPCWNPPSADEGTGHVTVLMHIRLDRSGGVIGTPDVASIKGMTAANGAYSKSLAGSVRRAIGRCSPLHLPPELYDAWSDVELNFDPKDLT